MKQKIRWGAILMFSMSLVLFSSCSNDDDDNPAKPIVKILELGSGHDSPNDKVAYIGKDAHIEADITVDGLIAEIRVEVHQENGTYEFEKVYKDSKYVGNKNATLHEHLDIPSDAPAGEYHLHLTVVDQWGQSSTAESELTLKAQDEVTTISIEGLKFGAGHTFPDNKIGYIGTTPLLEATSIKAEKGIDKIVVMMHSENEATAFVIKETYTYEGETELTDFHKHISIPEDAPAGDYHLHFDVYDKDGKSKGAELEIEIKESGIGVTDIEIGNNNSAKASNIHAEFITKATDPLKSIRIRIYKADTPTTYVFNETYSDEFAAGNVKEYTFHKHLKATGAAAGEYVFEIRVNDTKDASKTIKDKLMITAE